MFYTVGFYFFSLSLATKDWIFPLIYVASILLPPFFYLSYMLNIRTIRLLIIIFLTNCISIGSALIIWLILLRLLRLIPTSPIEYTLTAFTEIVILTINVYTERFLIKRFIKIKNSKNLLKHLVIANLSPYFVVILLLLAGLLFGIIYQGPENIKRWEPKTEVISPGSKNKSYSKKTRSVRASRSSNIGNPTMAE